MASSSSSSVQKSFKYDVFLSFRGGDTRNNFVGHLYEALQRNCIETYKDDKKIEQGKPIKEQLIKFIEDSRFYIIVFSKTYASSSWCLDELVKIMDCKKTTEQNVYPVFFDVEPTEVRYQSGAVKEAFAEHEKKVAARKWREAMKEASNLVGWELKATANGDESKLIQIIVDVIFNKKYSTLSNTDGNLVGMETRIRDVLSSLDIGTEDVRMIGIKGMGGGGKTTLARAIYDRLSTIFEGKSFVENVREVSQPSLSGLKKLQKRILKDVLNKQDITCSGVHDGKNMLKATMRCRKILVVLDDVDRIEQLEALAGELGWFKSGSRIIITTRDEQVLRAHGVKFVHDINLLSPMEATCLFSRYAFEREMPTRGYEELSGQVVRYAAGLPLTIKVLGSFLRGVNEREWKDALERLKTIPHQDTQKILKISYDALEPDFKDIFLDVACVLKGEQKDKAIRVLESCGFRASIGLSVLEKKSLVTISKYGCLGMHDRIEEMGKYIDCHSRLWIDKEIEDILASNLINEAIRCIKVSPQRLDLRAFMTGLRNMKKARVLYMCSGSYWDDSRVSQLFPNSLQYLCWRAYPFSSLHETFQADNLVGLDMSFSPILQLWLVGKGKALTKLRFLDLSYTGLRRLNLGLTPNLERLDLKDCWNLVEIYAPVGCLKNLLYLDLSGCGRFKSFLFDKQSKHVKVGSLSELHLIGESIETCPLHPDNSFPKFLLKCFYKEDPAASSFGNLEKLISIGLCSCTNLESFSRSICSLQCLKKLTLEGSIPEVFKGVHQLQCLEELSFSKNGIENLPDSVCMLKQLKSLKLKYCFNLKKLPDDISQLESLQELCLSHAKIKHLPDGFCMLNKLKSLKLESCRDLEKLPEDFGQLESLQELCLSHAEIKHLPDGLCMLKQLKSLKLYSCWHLEKLPMDFGQLESLQELCLSHAKITHLPDCLCMLKQLKSLKLEFCQDLEKLPEDFGQLESLQELCLLRAKIKHLPDGLCMLKQLKSLKLEFCRNLEKLPKDFGQLESLQELCLSNAKIKHLPDGVCMLKQLKSLNLEDCSGLKSLPEDFGQLESLQELWLSRAKIKHLPNGLCMLKQLKSLKLYSCLDLKSLAEDFGELESLEKLKLSSTGISRLPDSICMLKHLKYLEIEWLERDQKLLEDLGRLQCLEKLIIRSCQFYGGFPKSIFELKRLKYFHLLNCTLDDLPEELGHFKCLEELDITGTIISHLPQSIFQLKGLRIIGLKTTLELCGLTPVKRTSDNGVSEMFCYTVV